MRVVQSCIVVLFCILETYEEVKRTYISDTFAILKQTFCLKRVHRALELKLLMMFSAVCFTALWKEPQVFGGNV